MIIKIIIIIFLILIQCKCIRSMSSLYLNVIYFRCFLIVVYNCPLEMIKQRYIINKIFFWTLFLFNLILNLFRQCCNLVCLLIVAFPFLTEGDTLAGFSVYVSNTSDWRSGTLCYQHDIKQPSNNTVNIDCFTSGRYVTIYNSRFQTNVSSLSEFAYINICEINITGNTLFRL